MEDVIKTALQLKRNKEVQTLEYYKNKLETVQLNPGEPMVILYKIDENDSEPKVGFIIGTNEGNKLLVSDFNQNDFNVAISAITEVIDDISEVIDEQGEEIENINETLSGAISYIENGEKKNQIILGTFGGATSSVTLDIEYPDVYLDDVKYSGNVLTFTWVNKDTVNGEATKTVEIPVSDYFTPYNEGDGILIDEDNNISIKLAEDEETQAFLKLDENGLSITGLFDIENTASNALNAIKNSVGLDENGNYITDTSATFISGATDVSNALSILDNAIVSSNNVYTEGFGIKIDTNDNNKVSLAEVIDLGEFSI